jgi:hypothetical protein
MVSTQPQDFEPLNDWFKNAGHHVFTSPKLVSYHLKPIQKDLIEAGAMAKIGSHIYLHKTRFWPEYQRIIAAGLEGKQ